MTSNPVTVTVAYRVTPGHEADFHSWGWAMLGAGAQQAARLTALADARGWHGRAAFHVGHRTWTHGEVHELAARAATVLAGHGRATGC